MDLKADKTFAFSNMNINAYIWVLNVLNRLNPASVYTSTGVSNETGWLATPTGDRAYGTPEEQDLYELAQTNPNNYDIPRMVRFGLRTSF